MTSPRAFFIPGVSAAEVEGVYASYAKLCHCTPLPCGQRIASITFGHDDVLWTATVGQLLRGETLPNSRSRSKKPFRAEVKRDPAVVLTIFDGSPYQVVTNHWGNAPVGSAWANPFMAGSPRSVQHFDQSDLA